MKKYCYQWYRLFTQNAFGVSSFFVLFVFCVMIFSVMMSPLYAVDTIQGFMIDLQGEYSDAQSSSTKKTLPQRTERGWLYKQALQLTQEDGLVTSYEAVRKTVDTINKGIAPWCGYRTSDVLHVLVSDPDIYGELLTTYGRLPTGINPWSEQAFAACKTYYACQGDTAPMTNRRFQACSDHIQSLYVVAKTQLQWLHSIDQMHYGDNIFYDGNPDNASYDLLVDISQITDLIYESNELPGETFFYEFPSILRIPGQEDRDPTDAFDDVNVDFDGGDPIGTGSQTDNQTWSWTVDDPDTTEDPTTQTGVDTSLQDFISDAQNNTNNQPDSFDNVVQGNVCLLPTTPHWSWGDQTSDELFETYQDLLHDYRSELGQDVFDESWSWSILDDLTDELLANAMGNFLSFSTDFDDDELWEQCMASCDEQHTNADGETNDLAWTVCVADCCLSACNVYEWTDRLLCKSQCLCGEFGNRPSDTVHYKVRICRIPAEPKTIWPKHVMSIEEVVSELSNIAYRIVTEWRNLKHTTQREMMDSSMSSNRFSDLFSFNAFVTIKPIRWGIKEKPKKDKLTQENKQLTNVLLNTRGDMALEAERNKYRMIYDPAPDNASKNPTQTLRSFLTTEEFEREKVAESEADEVALRLSLQKQIYADKAKQMYDFLDVHQTMFGWLFEALLRLQTTARNMAEKSK